MNRAIAACVFSLFWSATAAASCPDGSPAQQYLSAIEAMNWSRMEAMLAENAVYTDPTMTFFDREAIHLVGADNIVNFWRGESEKSGTSEIDYTTTQCFETAGYYVVNLDIDVRVEGAFWNVDKAWINLPGKVLSIIRIENGKVKEHHDYVEYSAASDVVSGLQQKYGVVEN